MLLFTDIVLRLAAGSLKDLNLLVLLPLAILEIAIILFGIYDILRPYRAFKVGNRDIWLLVILLFNTIGLLVYFVVARSEKEEDL